MQLRKFALDRLGLAAIGLLKHTKSTHTLTRQKSRTMMLISGRQKFCINTFNNRQSARHLGHCQRPKKRHMLKHALSLSLFFFNLCVRLSFLLSIFRFLLSLFVCISSAFKLLINDRQSSCTGKHEEIEEKI